MSPVPSGTERCKQQQRRPETDTRYFLLQSYNSPTALPLQSHYRPARDLLQSWYSPVTV